MTIGQRNFSDMRAITVGIAAVAISFLLCGFISAATVETKISWAEGKPQLGK